MHVVIGTIDRALRAVANNIGVHRKKKSADVVSPLCSVYLVILASNNADNRGASRRVRVVEKRRGNGEQGGFVTVQRWIIALHGRFVAWKTFANRSLGNPREYLRDVKRGTPRDAGEHSCSLRDKTKIRIHFSFFANRDDGVVVSIKGGRIGGDIRFIREKKGLAPSAINLTDNRSNTAVR